MSVLKKHCNLWLRIADVSSIHNTLAARAFGSADLVRKGEREREKKWLICILTRPGLFIVRSSFSPPSWAEKCESFHARILEKQKELYCYDVFGGESDVAYLNVLRAKRNSLSPSTFIPVSGKATAFKCYSSCRGIRKANFHIDVKVCRSHAIGATVVFSNRSSEGQAFIMSRKHYFHSKFERTLA